MELKSLLEIEKAFHFSKWITIVSIIVSLIIAACSLYTVHSISKNINEFVYITVDDQLIKARRVKNERQIEAFAHVNHFHQLFFRLHPDKEQIQRNTTEALSLIDKSGYEAYNQLKESGFYSNLLSGNISTEIEKDSIYIMPNYPNIIIFAGKQRIIRPTSVTIRSLRTRTYLRSVDKTSTNPFGYIMERWTVLENEDLNTYNR